MKILSITSLQVQSSIKMRDLYQYISKTPNLEELKFTGTHFTSHAFKELQNILLQCPNLTCLTLDECDLGKGDSDSVCNMLAGLRKLKQICLSRNRFPYKNMVKIIKSVFQYCNDIEEISLASMRSIFLFALFNI